MRVMLWKAILVMFLVNGIESQTSCDFELQLVSTQMGNFNTRGYRPLHLNQVYDELNSLRATVLATYQLCLGKIIIDPDSLFPQDISQCMLGLYNVSLLSNKYTGNFAKIRADIDSIAKIVFSTQNDCRPVLYYKGWANISDDCKNALPAFHDLLNKYNDDLILGGNGTKFINDMLLSTEKMRKYCDFNILTKAKSWSQDSCQAANEEWLYPLTDQLDTILTKNLYTNFTSSFYNLYQSIYRVKDVCNVSITQE